MDRTDSPAARAVRLYVELLLRGRLQTSAAARLLGVDVRRARSDLRMLAEITPLTPSGEGRDRTWVLDPSHAASRTGILDYLSLQVGKELTCFLEGTSLHRGLDRAQTLGSDRLPSAYTRNIDRKFRHHQEPARSYAGQDELLDNLIDALLRERLLSVETRRADGEQRRLQGLQPLTLVIYRRAVYLLARDPQRGTVLRLPVDRMEAASVGEPFDYPHTWDPDAELSHSFGIRNDPPAQPVVLRFSPSVRPYVEARRWHPTATLTPLEDGGVELRMTAGGVELVRWVLEWGAHCEVVEPAWLRERVVGELRGALARYAPEEVR